MYEGFTLRVIGFTVSPQELYEHAVGGKAGGFALMKWQHSKSFALAKPVSGDEAGQPGYRTYTYGDYYSFALRAASDKNGEAYQMYEFDYKLLAMGFPWSELPTDGRLRILDLVLSVGGQYTYWKYAPRSQKGLL
ncbi:hypothetical protein MTO96_015308 [Rhipicephalus appendiculatus]